MPSDHDRVRAFREGPTLKVPFDVWPKDKDRFPPFPFPFLGEDASTSIKGWKLVRVYSVSKGPSNNTMVWTEREFISIIKEGNGYAYIGKGPLKTIIGEFIHHEY